MAVVRNSSFPAVLKQYLPEYELPVERRGRCSHGSHQHSDQKERTGVRTESRRGQHQKDEGSRSRTPGLRRESTSEQLKKQQRKKWAEQYERWEQVKVEVREAQYEDLQTKVELQHELIQARDKLRDIRQRELEQQHLQKRLAEKNAKQAKADELQQICKQSIDEDKKKAAEKRATQKKAASPVADEAYPKSSPRGTSPQMGQKRMASDVSSVSSVSSREMHVAHVSPRDSPLAEEEEEEDTFITSSKTSPSGGRDSGGVGDGMEPWYKSQLYHLFGTKEADYFLYPKMEEQPNKSHAKPIQNQAKKYVGHVGASELWYSLRDDSKMKLYRDDQTIPQELKMAYNAFIRQTLVNRKRKNKRNFFSEEDIPDIQKLMDQSRIKNAHDYKHKVELMYRLSHTNEDRSRILMFNNPPQDLNNKEGLESCSRYMPSWIPGPEDIQSDASSEASYKKWIKSSRRQQTKQAEGAENTRESGSEEESKVNSKWSLTEETPRVQPAPDTSRDDFGDEWEFLKSARKKSASVVKAKAPAYHFLTEEEATVPGEFSKRRQELMEARTKPQAYNEKVGRGAHSMMALYGDGDRGSARSTLNTALDSPRDDLRSQSQMSQSQYMSSWQPLSLHALKEYKEKIDVLGSGDFSQGRTAMWQTAR